MIFFLEPNKTAGSHAVINASMLKILAWREKNAQLKVFASGKHIENLKSFTEGEIDADFLNIKVIDGDFKTWIVKEIIEIFNIFLILRKAKKNKVEFVYISSLFPIAHYFFKIIKRWFPNVRVIVGLHGEVEFIRSDKELKLRFLGFFLKRAFRIKSDRETKYLVFGEAIRLNLLKYNLLKIEDFIVIDHPYEYRTKHIWKEIGDYPMYPIQFGTIGIGTINKNTHHLFILGKELQFLISKGRIRLKAIGRMEADLKAFYNNYVDVPFKKMASRENFDKEIDKLDYSLFFYDNSFYQLCASGSLFDSINLEKPILAMRNDYFDYYFDRLGNIGYLFENISDMKSKIIEISEGKLSKEYYIQKSNLTLAKKKLSLANISEDFWRQYNI